MQALFARLGVQQTKKLAMKRERLSPLQLHVSAQKNSK